MKWIFGKDGKSSIRAGYSISYLHDGFTVVSNALGTGNTNPGLIQNAASTTPVGVLTAAGVPLTIAPFQIPITDAANLKQNSANGLWTFDPNLRTPYVQQWSFGIEREIARDTALEVRYVGNHAIKVYRAINIKEVNIYENGFLNEFLGAQKNLSIFTAANPKCGQVNQPACNFGNSGLPGQVALPAMSTLFTDIPSSSGFASTTLINNLNNNNIGALVNTLALVSRY